MKYALILTLPLVLFLSGCAKMMNENECVAADWRSVGFSDGTQGRAQDWLGKRAEACAEYGVTPNMDQYLMGRDQGLVNYCQPRRGFDVGLRGQVYENVCPQNLAGPFLAGLQDGSGLRGREQRVSDIDNSLSTAHHDLDQIEQDIAAHTTGLLDGNLTTEERVQFALDIKNWAEEMGAIRANIPAMEAELVAAQHDLDAYRASIIAKYPGAF